tara:strand:+ start:1600 stop:2520 length:921 start_codon:yes stop_codon:yes gene_type:complete
MTTVNMTNDTLNLQEARTKCDQLEKENDKWKTRAEKSLEINLGMMEIDRKRKAENEDLKENVPKMKEFILELMKDNKKLTELTEIVPKMKELILELQEETGFSKQVAFFQKTIEELKKENEEWKTSYMKHKESIDEIYEINLELIKDNEGLTELTQILETTDAVKSGNFQKTIEELTEELEMWKKYKHLDLSKLCPVDDTNFGCWEYWDFVVWKECLMKLDQNTGEPLPKEKQDNPEYIKFCKYFPRPRDVDNEEEEEEETIEEPFCENGLCNGGQKFEIKDKMFCSPMCGNKYFNLEEDDSYYWH